MMYMYCTECGRMTPGEVSINRSSSLRCKLCGHTGQAAQFVSRKCEVCEAVLFEPREMEGWMQCPCTAAPKIAPAAEELHTFLTGSPAAAREDAAAPVAQKKSAYPVIACPRCAASLHSEDGHYGPCPVCGKTPAQTYVTQQLYFLSEQQKPIVIQWAPEPDELVYVHHHAGHIPANSLLIVHEGQTAVYVSGGQQHVLDKAQTYAIFGDDLDTGTIARGINAGKLNLPPIALKLNTRIIFFDQRLHELPMMVKGRVSVSGWSIELPLTAFVKIVSADALLRNALNLHDQENVSDYLKQKVIERLQNLIMDELTCLPTEAAEEAETEQDIVAMVARALNEHERDILDFANKRLTMDFGVSVERIDVAYRRSACMRRR
ncbi:MAG: hypothetical protein ACI4MJ_11290 [Aristaeellaceae bacterium]